MMRYLLVYYLHHTHTQASKQTSIGSQNQSDTLQYYKHQTPYIYSLIYIIHIYIPWSDSKGKSSPYFLEKSRCFSTESTDTPTICTPVTDMYIHRVVSYCVQGVYIHIYITAYIGQTQLFVFIDIFFKASRLYCATTSKITLLQQTMHSYIVIYMRMILKSYDNA